ncbi:acyl-CoA thioester hydrolase [Oceanospirillum multiglobuliferum]|uniref:Thioesterase n=1 Tax=Oceanospirillum multiglobuliferum TaxID=64969 RepID=A0A1T4RWR3_9GAMM|nr:acyl-CoA thioesterase [Oceanospirillum multiglobuliferum]OPX54577.1 hypothetical protein BTE48_13420 [Oceanospirillum multiglobuliferum]SKA20385.1 acyl-CoA thioester hydrolase [Oceanospirillum multiglobuliferum]
MAQVSDALYEKTIEVRWSDCDANQHMRHSAYADFCAHTRVGFMHQVGINEKWLKEHGLGPVLFKEETEYFRELFMGELVRVTLEAGEPTGSEKSICVINHLYNAKGELAARHRAVFGWFDMTQRKVVKLPETIRQLCLPEPETLE